MRRFLWVGLMVAAVFGVCVLGNEAPTAPDLSLTTWEGRSLSLSVVVTDEDIVPLTPDVHPIRFAVEAAPEHGVVTAEFERVFYTPPNEARLVMTYTPADGFAGQDSFIVLAEDPLGEATRTLVTIEVRPRDGEGVLSGDVHITTSLDTQTGPLVGFHWGGAVVYRNNGYAMQVGYCSSTEPPPTSRSTISTSSWTMRWAAWVRFRARWISIRIRRRRGSSLPMRR